jgi:hypothetical protein
MKTKWSKEFPKTTGDSNDIEPHEKFWVETSEPQGLTLTNADQAIKILNNTP